MSLLDILRANTGLAIVSALLVAGTAIIGLVAWLMHMAGTSIRPAAFVAIFCALIVLPQFIGQLALAVRPLAGAGAASTGADPGAAGAWQRLYADAEFTFGPGAHAADILDVRASFGPVLPGAVAARLATLPEGATVLVARFADAAAASSAAQRYAATYQLAVPQDGPGSGWHGKSAFNGAGYALQTAGPVLYVCMAPSVEQAAARRMAAVASLQALAQAAAADASADDDVRTAQPLVPQLQFLVRAFRPFPMRLGGMLVLLLCTSLWFFRGSSWAATLRPPAGTTTAPVTLLRSQLLALNEQRLPLRVTPGTDASELYIDWHYEDEYWSAQARARGLRRSFRVRLRLDEQAHRALVTDFFASHDWHAGGGAAAIAWQQGSGIRFFQRESRLESGAPVDPARSVVAEQAQGYRFDVAELKAPAQQAVIAAGWSWQPAVWASAPRALRWLTGS